MKRTLFLFLAFFTFTTAKLHAVGFFKTQEYTVMRSTAVNGSSTQFLVSTGIILLESIEVTTGSTSGCTFQFFDSTNTSVTISSSPIYDTDTSGTFYHPRKILKNGFMFTTTGAAQLDIKWDWLIMPPPGQETRGQ